MLKLNYVAALHRAYTMAQNNDWVGVQRVCEELYAKNKSDPGLHALLAQCAVHEQDNEKAIWHLNKCISLEPNNPEHYLSLAGRLTFMSKHSQAVKVFQKARRRFSKNKAINAALADSLERAGEYEKARELLTPIMEAHEDGPATAEAWARLAMRDKNPEEAIRALTSHIDSPKTPPNIFYTLGLAYERLGKVEQSFHSFREANLRQNLSFDPEEYISEYTEVTQFFSKEFLTTLPKPKHDTSKPLFIAGRPRSGTTLIEKILDSHPDVTGVGEIPYMQRLITNFSSEVDSLLPYPRSVGDVDQNDVTRLSQGYLDVLNELAPTARRTVDKNLASWQHLGVIFLLTPQAHVLHVKRNELDNCWACFSSHLTLAWSCDLRHIGLTFRLYERLMQHWHEVLDLPILDIDYEAVVDDQEGWTRRILEFCGLEWDERCLRFYEESANKKDAVAAPTLSYDQVRQPIYKSSVGRAQQFEPYLEELHKGLEEGKRIADAIITRSA